MAAAAFSPGWYRWCSIAALAILGLVVVLSVVLTAWQNTTRNRTSGKTVGIVGRKGAGKSYNAVRLALDRLSRGVDVYSNFTIDTTGLGVAGTWRFFEGWEHLAVIRNAVVIIDEAHLRAPSHAHLRFPMVARAALSDSRKLGIDLYWLTQHEDRVNRTLKDLTDEMVLTVSYFGGRLFRLKAWEPEDFRKPKKQLWRRWVRRRMDIARCYNTLEQMDVDEYALIGDASADVVRRLQRERALARQGGAPADAERSTGS